MAHRMRTRASVVYLDCRVLSELERLPSFTTRDVAQVRGGSLTSAASAVRRWVELGWVEPLRLVQDGGRTNIAYRVRHLPKLDTNGN